MARTLRTKRVAKKRVAKKKPPSTKFSQALFDSICERLAVAEPLLQICQPDDMPDRNTVYKWSERTEELQEQYARARDRGYDHLAERIEEISKTPQTGTVTTTEYVNGEEVKVTIKEEDMLAHRKLQIDTYRWLLSKWQPNKFGDKLQHTGDGGGNVKVEVYIPDNGRK